MFYFLQFLLPFSFSVESVPQDFPINPDQYQSNDKSYYKDNNYYANKQLLQKPRALASCIDSESSTQEYDNLFGLINVTCDKLNHIKNFGRCNKVGASGGSHVNVSGSLSYTFNGTRVHVVAYDQPYVNSGGVMQISIDGKVVGTACPNRKDGSYRVVFSSDYYPFGEHVILIEHISTVAGSSFVINSLLVDPLPKVGGHVLGFNDIAEVNDGSWTYHDTKTPYFSTKNQVSCTFKFHGTRFWLTGIRHKDNGMGIVYIDGNDKGMIEERVVDFDIGQLLGAYGNQGVLIYESEVLDLDDHTIEILNMPYSELFIVNLIYTTQPYNAIVIPLEEISFDSNWKKEEDYYWADRNQSSASITEYLDHFWVLGCKKSVSHVKMNVYLNNQFKDQADISLLKTAFLKEVLFKSIYDISHNNYLVKVEKMGYATSSLNISYFYYLNEKTLTVTDESLFISSEEMLSNSEGDWKKDGDYIYTEEKDASTTVHFNGIKFWIYGKVHPNYGKIEIILDGKNLGSVSFYSEKAENNIIMYESPDGYPKEDHTLKIVNLKQSEISLLKIVYQDLSSESNHFSKSEEFSNSGLFSRTEGFTMTGHFSNTDFFSQTEHFSASAKFSKSNFFSQTEHFSTSMKFSRSSFFSETGKFSRTEIFTLTDYFTKSSDFSRTSMFSQSQAFSRSYAFSASQNLPGKDVCILSNSEGNTSYDHCYFEEDKRTDAIVYVLLSNFTNYIEDKRNGGAIHIINCGIDCISVSFANCASNNGGGGAFYIKNWFDLALNITMHNLSFEGCKALYGGAGYIYSSSSSNDVTITESNFSDNIATEEKGTKENKNLFCGHHLFLTSRNLFISNCTFKKGIIKMKGSSVKIYNVFDQDGKSVKKLDDSRNNIMFYNCLFELDEESKSSINYINNKIARPIEFVDCTFIGKLAQNKHYIDGEVVSKNNDSIIIFNSCKFEYENEQVVNFGVFKEDQMINENKNCFGLNSLIFLLIAFIVDLFVIAAVFIVLKLAKRNIYLNDLEE